MGTAPTKSRAARQLARRSRTVRVPEFMKFVIFEDNGGAYRRRTVACGGAPLAQSRRASNQRAERAEWRVRDGAASVRSDRRADKLSPFDPAARRDRPSDDLNAERWFDEGGTFTREAVTRWPGDR